jgi:hypothetical protein
MGTPTRKLILANLQTTFEGVTTGNGYKTTVTTVQALARGYFDVKSGERPFIGYVPGAEAVQHQPGGNMYCTLALSIIGHITGNSLSDRQDKLNDLIDDIIAVLNVDTTRGANAISTTITGIETDEGDPDAHGDGSVLITAAIKYIRTISSS